MKIRIALAALMFSGSVLAAPNSPGIDLRQHHQDHRITQGVANGTLTRAEHATLSAQQRTIARTERVFERDGKLGRHERVTLHRMQNGANRSIYQQKHDRQRRF